MDTEQFGISYLRCSSDEQILVSIARQRHLNTQAAAKLGIPIVEEYVDAGVSSFRNVNLKDGKLGSIYQKALAGGFPKNGTHLFFENFDRFSRAGSDEGMMAMLPLTKAGLNLVTSDTGEVYGRGLTAIIKAAIELERSHSESSRKHIHQLGRWNQKRADARATKKIMTATTPGWISVEVVDGQRTFVLNAHVRTVRQIYEWAAAGIGQLTITRMLNEQGYATFKQLKNGRKGRWQRSTVKYILETKTVLGEFQPHRKLEGGLSKEGKCLKNGRREMVGAPIPDYYPLAIEHDLRQRARRQIARNTNSPGRRGPRFANLLSGLSRCNECINPRGHATAMTYQKDFTKAGSFLMCDNARHHGGCTNDRKFRVQDIERLVLDDLADHLLWTAKTEPDAALVTVREEVARLESELESLRGTAAWFAAQFRRNPAFRTSANEAESIVMAQSIGALESKLTKARTQLEAEVAKQPAEVHLRSINDLRENARSTDEAVAYPARSAINASLKEVIDEVRFHKSGDGNLHIRYGGRTRKIYIREWKIESDLPLLPDADDRAAIADNPDTFTETEQRIPLRKMSPSNSFMTTASNEELYDFVQEDVTDMIRKSRFSALRHRE